MPCVEVGVSGITWGLWLAVACHPSTDTRPGDDDDDDDTAAIVGHSFQTGETGGGETHSTPTGSYSVSNLASRLLPDAPSVVRVTWDQALAASVTVVFSFDGETRRAPTRALDSGSHEELLLGVPFGTDLTWWLELDGSEGAETTEPLGARTAPLPPKLPSIRVEASDPSGWDPDVEYVMLTVDEEGGVFLGGYWWAQIVDRKGRVVWAHRSEPGKIIMYPRVAATGHSLLFDLNSYWGSFDGGVSSQIQELGLDGVETSRWDAPGLHHSFTQLPDRTLVYGDYTGGLGAYEEEIVEIDPTTGDRTTILDCADWVASLGMAGAPCGTNTVSYDSRTNHLLVSWFTLDAISEVDLATNHVTRAFGHVPGAYAFDPVESAFWYQHGPYFTDTGTLLLSTHAEESHSSELVVREYEVDDGTETLHQVAVLGLGEGIDGEQMGEAHRLPGGDTLHNFGTNAHLREYQPDGDVVWELDWTNDHTIGRSEPLLVDLYDLVPARD